MLHLGERAQVNRPCHVFISSPAREASEVQYRNSTAVNKCSLPCEQLAYRRNQLLAE